MAHHLQIGATPIQPRHSARCHCGGVVLALQLPRGIEDPRRCNCSMCRRRGAICASVPVEDLEVVQGAELLARYQFNTRVAQHYFCKVCGIYTHHLRRSDPTVYAFNVACLDGVNPFDLGEVPTSDGANHILDRAGPASA